MNFKKLYFLATVICIFMMSACISSKSQKKPLNEVMNFNQGIKHLAGDIEAQFNDDFMSNITKLAKKQKLLLDPLMDANSGQALTINNAVENIFYKVLSPRFEVVKMGGVNSKTDIDFVLSGVLAFERIGNTANSAYHFYVSVYSKKTGIIKACSNAFIKLPEYKPISTYQDSPVFLRDNKLKYLTKSMKLKPGQKVNEKYLDYLNTKNYVVAAEHAYEKGDYKTALKNFQIAESYPDGKNLTVYSGLYNSARLLNMEDAETYFGQLINASIVENNKIEIKLLFKVNSAYFIDKGDLPKYYGMWLRQIAKQLKNNNACIHIQGHSSKTGKDAYNKALSLKRAKMVQHVLAVTYSGILKRSNVTGVGFSENIVGSGTDDARDAIDRRVEFILTECK